MTAISGAAVAAFLYKNIVTRFGCPSELVLDQGVELLNQTVAKLNDLLTIWHRFTTPYHPRCNGLAEYSNKGICQALSRMIYARNVHWDQYLQAAFWAYRTKVRVFMECTPFNLVCGCEARLPSHVERESVEYLIVKELAPEIKVMERRSLDLTGLEENREMMSGRLEEEQTRRKERYEQGRKTRNFVPGEFVLRLNPRRYQKKEPGSKFLPKWEVFVE